ncbi:hypothetical protein L798_11198 [Zootermopsis nevadensis]|uniref:Uncharacterized protein n=1 Tax=Zootermopsis nevadensis TaxID=136037 RepID=A0A067R5L0_ZOONE|nr:hypothetical protein L798_11198 [Zootermopsis nevadensis]
MYETVLDIQTFITHTHSCKSPCFMQRVVGGEAPRTEENNVQDLGVCKSIKFGLMMSRSSSGCKCEADNRLPALCLSPPSPKSISTDYSSIRQYFKHVRTH